MIVPLRKKQGIDELLKKDRKKLTGLVERRPNKEFIDLLRMRIMLTANHVLLIEATQNGISQCIIWFE